MRSFAEYQQVFGGLWQPSTLSYAVEQFFENGGREAVVVRVVQRRRAGHASRCPAARASLTLEALSPGSREVLRASVDYDNIGPNEEDRFNLVVQRVRSLGSEHIEDQEIFRRLSIVAGLDALRRDGAAGIRCWCACAAPCRQRVPTAPSVPARATRSATSTRIPTATTARRSPTTTSSAPPERGTGLFALRGLETLHFLCIPPPARDRDVGPERAARRRAVLPRAAAMLIVDPPAAWDTCDEALAGTARTRLPAATTR